MTDAINIKPCPWCGHEAQLDGPFLVFSVQCHSLECLATGPTRESPDQAIAAWNQLTDLVQAAAWLSEVDVAVSHNHPGIVGMWRMYEDEMDERQIAEAKNREDAYERLLNMRSAAWKDLDAALAAIAPAQVTPM